jgi:hypothetical protein
VPHVWVHAIELDGLANGLLRPCGTGDRRCRAAHRGRANGVEVLVHGEHGERCRARALAEDVRLPSSHSNEHAARAHGHRVRVPDTTCSAFVE